MTRLLALSAVAGAVLWSAAVWAHSPSAPPAAAPGTTEPRALAHFRGWTPDVTGPGWRAANDEMGRLGGHAGHLARRPGAAPAPPGDGGAPPPAPRRHPHHGGAR